MSAEIPRAVARCACIALCAVLLAVAALPVAAQASAGSVFFGGWYDDEIGSVGFDGASPSPSLIADDGIPQAMTVSGEYLYWEANSSPIRIGRSRLDGTDVQPQLIAGGPGQVNAEGLSVEGGRIYWSETRNVTGFGPSYLSSANLDGSGLAPRQLALGPNAAGPVIVAEDHVVFLSQRSARGVLHTNVVRMRLDGRGGSEKIAVDRYPVADSLARQRGYLYWVESGSRNAYIARASLDGSSIDTRFRRVPRKGCHMRSEMQGGAVGGRYYFIGCESGLIDRVALRGGRGLLELQTGATLGSGPVLAATP